MWWGHDWLFSDLIDGGQLSPGSISSRKDHFFFLALILTCLSLDIQAILTCFWSLGDFELNNIASFLVIFQVLSISCCLSSYTLRFGCYILMRIRDHIPLGVNWGYHPLLYGQVLESDSSPLPQTALSDLDSLVWWCWVVFFADSIS